jgi:arylsulfatase A-like enzyme
VAGGEASLVTDGTRKKIGAERLGSFTVHIIMTRRIGICRRLGVVVFLLAVALGLGANLWAQPSEDFRKHPSPPPKHPNIIFILADDLGYGELGCYGQTQILTTNLDRLAREGMRFTSCYAGSTVCAPSRAALMTGLNTGHVRIRGNKKIPLSPEDLTLGEFLKAANYNTCALGKWGLGDEGSTGMPRLQGFDEWFGYLNQVEAHDYYPVLLNRSDLTSERNVEVSENLNGAKGKYSDDYFTEAALNYIRMMKPKWYTVNLPYFLYLAYTIPHANDELGAKTGNGMEVPEDAPYSNQPWPQVEKNKASMITRLDRYVGTLLDTMKEAKTDTNTIIIFTSDNGPHKEGGVNPKFFHASGPLRGIKRDLYEGGIRVPMIVWWPGKIKAGTVSDLPVAFWDILPTVAGIAEKPAPGNIDGISFLPTLLGQAQTNRHEFLYWEFHENGFKQAVRMGNWKGVRFGVDGPLELYNLKTDIGETKNVAAENAPIVAKIEEYLKTARTEDTNWPALTAAKTKKTEYGK